MLEFYRTRILNCLALSESKENAFRALNEISDNIGEDTGLTINEYAYLLALCLAVGAALDHTADFVLDNLFEFNQ